ncbi:hypothetical protein RN001_008005 [Aquatica leii]|uniref:Uncharacterized protein n=1 Tax=Aquatica leii TaxID=1421715 RepID=A0AAN7PX23_9COLE|nr:hypothetical protein RN001_008005 [Aquatica leii]
MALLGKTGKRVAGNNFTIFFEVIRKWLINNPGRAVSIYQIGKLFRFAYLKAAVLQTAIIEFEKTGIYSFLHDLRFIPVENGRRTITKFDKRQGKTAIISSAPYKLELELKGKEKNEKTTQKVLGHKAKTV